MTATHFTVTIGTVCLYLAAIVNAAPGRVGCFYDLQLCEQSELCFNDSLFGTCVTQLSDAINYSDLEPEALGEAAQVLQYLIETGYKWHDSYTQCVVGKFLQSAVTHQRYDPDVCEYLKALLDVIDQNKGGPHGAVDQLPDQAAVAPVDMAPPPPPPPSSSQIGSGSLSEVADPRSAHGEFLTQADMSSDFEQSDQESLPIEPMLSVSSNQDQNPQQEPSSFDFQQYLRAYQEALQQQQPQTRDLVSSAVEKKSDPSVPVIATTTATPVEATTSASSSFLAQLNNSAADEAENIQAMRALLALINQYVPSAGDGQATPTSRDQQEMTIGIPIPPQSQEISPEVFEQILRQQQQQQAPSENFQLSGDYPPYPVEDVYVPDFTAIPPPEILQDMLLRSARAQLQSSPRISLADLFIAEQLFGPPPQQQQQQSMIVDPRMLMDPRSRRMDPQMMQQQQQQQQFDRFDPRILMELQQQMDPRMLRQQQMDPRMLMGLQQQQQQLDPRMFMEDQQQQQVDPRMFMDPRMAMMGDPSWMMQQQQQQPMTDPRAVFSQGFGMNQNMMMSPWMQGPQGRMMDNGPFDLEMPMKRGGGDFAPFAGLNNGMSQPPYMMQQGGPDPRMMMMLDPRMQSLYAPPPYGFFPQNLAQEWRPPMALPEGFSVAFGAQGFPVIEAPLNESAEADRQFVGENEEQSANGASGPTSPNKKDQEYRSLMPSDESQDSVGEDVTVTVVKGSAEKPIPSGSDAADGSEDDYVFLITEPRLDLDQARYFLTWLAAVMNMPAQTFYDVSVSDDLMTFRVNPAVESLNATYVAQTLGGDDLRNGLRQTNNMEVLRAGVGRYTLDKSSGVDGPLMRFQQTAVVQSESAAAVEAEIAKKYDVVDPTYAFIVTEPALTYDKARRMLNWLSVKLHVPQTIFSSLLIEDHQLLFRVSPYYNQINASGVVDRLSDAGIQAELRKEFQVEIIRNGIGDRVQIVKADKRQRETLLIGLIAVACVAAILISLGIIYLVRRNIMMRKKLAGLGGDVESSKEYEELCRQRMASKNIESAVSSSPDHKNHDRSSTSSWSEEPAPTNMDITTGHMVLSYMEDHLKHKERMNEEWASLCAYEADPSRTEAGSKLENLIKNRYPDVLPYDHTRVHLKPEGNSTKSDYVNANLITDADPKNAAYIATQGPLPDTVSDFWQMIWESNSTVIVMLTKLRENEQDLCHVYWPKEGSECYHIFEVHLVSEHIWCDDYLVRNFYLKNLQTHETRTVTQFHYLNWPNLGVPSSLKTFLEFRRKINKCYKGGSSPIVVHCSDGVDRTGAYCLIDLVLNRMAKGVKEIDIAATLEHLRDQRIDMVRTKEQFEFVLTAVAQEIQAILKSMPQK